MTQHPPPYQDPYAQPVPPAKPGVKVWQVLTVIGVSVFLGTVLVCGGAVALMMTAFQQQFNQFSSMVTGNTAIPNLSYTMQTPPTVTQNQPFEIELTLENTGSSPMTIHSLSDYSELTLLSSDPPWQSLSGSEMIYQLTLDPNQPQTIKVTAQSSVVDSALWVNIDANQDSSGMMYSEAFATINVQPAPPASAPAPAETPSP